ncbi:uncharacterized protein M6D78_011098 [Vipera latastei]
MPNAHLALECHWDYCRRCLTLYDHGKRTSSPVKDYHWPKGWLGCSSHVYRLHGVPRRIISDRGVQFTAQFWREFLRHIGSTQGLSSGYHPSTNGAAERVNATVERLLRSGSLVGGAACQALPACHSSGTPRHASPSVSDVPARLRCPLRISGSRSPQQHRGVALHLRCRPVGAELWGTASKHQEPKQPAAGQLTPAPALNGCAAPERPTPVPPAAPAPERQELLQATADRPTAAPAQEGRVALGQLGPVRATTSQRSAVPAPCPFGAAVPQSPQTSLRPVQDDRVAAGWTGSPQAAASQLVAMPALSPSSAGPSGGPVVGTFWATGVGRAGGGGVNAVKGLHGAGGGVWERMAGVAQGGGRSRVIWQMALRVAGVVHGGRPVRREVGGVFMELRADAGLCWRCGVGACPHDKRALEQDAANTDFIAVCCVSEE